MAARIVSQRAAMASREPAPFRRMVSSLVTVTDPVVPRRSAVTFSNLMSSSSENTTPPVNVLKSNRIDFRLSPNPGAL
ncbi:MAG: hypothetical protein BJ554DRAFT_7120 [Olpidium bornovanus]|uniref:Uncharacterized protein n=1 Tax=Olpidium bornovanus TaxID=278681 RepID=A0A8H7ZWZ8_9FUNG|nr:MAG: hypothetical protein BJ554DRAFT_7120 [Olpidium bornovanus]